MGQQGVEWDASSAHVDCRLDPPVVPPPPPPLSAPHAPGSSCRLWSGPLPNRALPLPLTSLHDSHTLAGPQGRHACPPQHSSSPAHEMARSAPLSTSQPVRGSRCTRFRQPSKPGGVESSWLASQAGQRFGGGALTRMASHPPTLTWDRAVAGAQVRRRVAPQRAAGRIEHHSPVASVAISHPQASIVKLHGGGGVRVAALQWVWMHVLRHAPPGRPQHSAAAASNRAAPCRRAHLLAGFNGWPRRRAGSIQAGQLQPEQAGTGTR